MSCEKYENLISYYIENDITQEEKEDLELHLTNCENCREQLEAIRYMQKMLKQENKEVKGNKIRFKIYGKLYRDFLIMFAGLVIIVSVVSISGGLAQMFLFEQLSQGIKIFFYTGISLLIGGLIILIYDVFINLYKLISHK